MLQINVKFIWNQGSDISLGLPDYRSSGASGADIKANFDIGIRAEGIDLHPGRQLLIPTGLSVEIPKGFEIQIRPRSGLTLKDGISIPNSPGTIDSDYRGPLGVIMINFSESIFHISHGDRIAQMVVAPVIRANFELVSELSSTTRGIRGFGSTGKEKC
ncbi:MAG: dUTP diphosphatase [Proteobacteria bacterium]|jgi:dUTP pyrophosphatase|nr:dUTP diphosphatase [Pseudomonadota bacterium]